MKVVIGPYKNWIGPYQIADAIFFWQDKHSDTCPWADRAHRFGTWLAENRDGSDSWLTKVCNWIYSKRERQVYVRIDNYDVWNMDHTLALIALPMLKRLKQVKHGAPKVDDFDCPQHLWSTNAPPKENEWDLDEHWFARWDYVLDEIIWAFEQEVDDSDTDKFYDHSQVDERAGLEEQISKIKVDTDGLNHHEHRKQMGFKLFGKYYQALWD